MSNIRALCSSGKHRTSSLLKLRQGSILAPLCPGSSQQLSVRTPPQICSRGFRIEPWGHWSPCSCLQCVSQVLWSDAYSCSPCFLECVWVLQFLSCEHVPDLQFDSWPRQRIPPLWLAILQGFPWLLFWGLSQCSQDRQSFSCNNTLNKNNTEANKPGRTLWIDQIRCKDGERISPLFLIIVAD